MKKLTLLLILAGGLIFSAATLQAQVTIGSNANPDANALLDLKNQANVDASTKGLLLPRVKLTSTANAAPLTAHTYGMIVFNTAKVNDVDSAFYYNDGKKWVRIAAATGSFWGLKGNAATDSATNFLGTTDTKKPLIFRTNNTPRMIVSSNGNVGIGTNKPVTKLDVYAGNTPATIGTGFKLTDGSQGDGKILTSDMSGNASWKNNWSSNMVTWTINGTATFPLNNEITINGTSQLLRNDFGASLNSNIITIPAGTYLINILFDIYGAIEEGHFNLVNNSNGASVFTCFEFASTRGITTIITLTQNTPLSMHYAATKIANFTSNAPYTSVFEAKLIFLKLE